MILLAQDYLKRRPAAFLGWLEGLGVPMSLRAGDANFWAGDGETGVCVEVKEPLDLVTCLTQTGRLVQQIRNARDEGHRVYVLVAQGLELTEGREVGRWGRGRDGKGRVMPVIVPGSEGETVPYRNLDNFLNSLTWIENVVVKRSNGEKETAQIILDLWHWFQKAPEEHESTTRFYTPVHLPMAKIGLVRRVAKELPGIGLERSRAVEKRFRSVWDMANAGEREWEQVEGVGKTTAKRVVGEIRGKGE